MRTSKIIFFFFRRKFWDNIENMTKIFGTVGTFKFRENFKRDFEKVTSHLSSHRRENFEKFPLLFYTEKL